MKNLLSTILLSLWPCVAAAQALLLDETVALIEPQGGASTRSVLFSEVELEARMERGKHGRSPLDGPLTREELDESMRRLVQRTILHVEAERLDLFQLDDEDAQEVLRRFIHAVGERTYETWLALGGLSEEEILNVLLMEARVERYLEGRFRLAARPRREEVEEAMKLQPHLRGEEGWAAVEAYLAQRHYETLVDRFTSDVVRRAKVRTLRDFRLPEGGVPLHGSTSAPQLQEGKKR